MAVSKSVELDLNSLDDEAEDDSLFKSIRGYLIFGRVIGLLPYQGIFSKSSKNLKFSWLGVPSIISYLILGILIFNSTLELLRSLSASKSNAYEIAQSIRSSLYNVWGTVIYASFVFRANSFLSIFPAWRSCSLTFTKPDVTLKRDSIIIALIILVSATLENAVLYTGLAQQIIFPSTPGIYLDGHKKTNGTLQDHYYNFAPSWERVLPYNAFLSVFAFIQHKFVLFGWNFMDILIAILGRALYHKYKSLCEVATATLVEPYTDKPRFTDNPKAIPIQDQQPWIQMTNDHRKIGDLLQAFEDFLSPLIFCSYTINIYYICMQLLDGLTIDLQTNSWVDAVNRPWSFLHLIMRVYILSICCARINVYAHKIACVINDCPSECYNSDISRLDKRVSGSREIGLSGLGCFTVTKPFILTFISVVFTFEIVLLQVSPNTQVGSSNQKCT